MMILLLLLSLQSPDTVRLSERICSACELRVDSVAAVGTLDGPGALSGRQIFVTRDGRGQLLIAGASASSQISVFDSSGRFLQLVGRGGAGPGEYRRIWRITPSTQGVVVTDDFARRHTMLDGRFGFITAVPASGMPEALLPGPNGWTVEAAILKTGADAGFALILRDSSGRLRHRLSPVPTPYTEAMRDAYRRTLTPALDDGQFWVASRHEYAFERCHFVTARCTRFERRASWFRAPLPSQFLTSESMERLPPIPMLQGIGQDDPRYVWAVTLVADSAWRSGLSFATRPHVSVVDLNRYYDSIIERIDVVSGTVVARLRIDPALMWGPLTGGYAAFYREDADGIPQVIVVRLSVVGKM